MPKKVSENQPAFDFASTGGDSSLEEYSYLHTRGGGAIPTSPLQPRLLRVDTINRASAKHVWEHLHYLRRDVPGCIEQGVYYGSLLVGALAWSRRIGGKSTPKNTIELRRFWLHDNCAKNSESRTMRVAIRMLRKLHPDLEHIVSYSDPSKGHQGTIYKASGFRYCGITTAQPWSPTSRRRMRADGSVKEQFGDEQPKMKWQLDFDTGVKLQWFKCANELCGHKIQAPKLRHIEGEGYIGFPDSACIHCGETKWNVCAAPTEETK